MIIVIINYIVSNILNLTFLEISFFIGMISSIITGFFSSEGGIVSRMVDFKCDKFLDKDYKSSYFTKFNMSIPFITSMAYMIIAFIINIIVYREYFIK